VLTPVYYTPVVMTPGWEDPFDLCTTKHSFRILCTRPLWRGYVCWRPLGWVEGHTGGSGGIVTRVAFYLFVSRSPYWRMWTIQDGWQPRLCHQILFVLFTLKLMPSSEHFKSPGSMVYLIRVLAGPVCPSSGCIWPFQCKGLFWCAGFCNRVIIV